MSGGIVPVVCGIIYDDKGKFLIARRNHTKPMAGLWEFPGGKIEQGETEAEALQRELMEEFGMSVEVGERVGSNVHHYDSISINLIAYKCRYRHGTFNLTDHDLFDWVDKEELKTYRLAPADVPFAEFV
jgi:8-oxo-dGTP diphosphatase